MNNEEIKEGLYIIYSKLQKAIAILSLLKLTQGGYSALATPERVLV